MKGDTYIKDKSAMEMFEEDAAVERSSSFPCLPGNNT